jgi:hypothetical protein
MSLTGSYMIGKVFEIELTTLGCKAAAMAADHLSEDIHRCMICRLAAGSFHSEMFTRVGKPDPVIPSRKFHFYS